MTKEDRFIMLARVGFAARGFLYLVIAWLVVETGRAADLTEAMRYVADGDGRILMAVLLAGFIAYGAWRLSDAALDTEGHGDGTSAAVKRAGAAASGLIYLFFAWQAYTLLTGNGASGGGSASGGGPEEQTQTVMQLPGGTLLLLIGAAVLAGVGAYQIVKAAKAGFCDRLQPGIAQQWWTIWFGRLGYGARGIIFLVTAYFLLQAALTGDSSQAGGMEEALSWLSRPVSLAVATGLALFGLFSLIEARYRRIHGPHSIDI